MDKKQSKEITEELEKVDVAGGLKPYSCNNSENTQMAGSTIAGGKVGRGYPRYVPVDTGMRVQTQNPGDENGTDEYRTLSCK